MSIQKKLKELDLELPQISSPGGNYIPVNIRGDIAYVAIQMPKLNGENLYLGRLGDELTTAQGYKAMQLCALNVLAHIQHKIGFKNVLGLNHISAYYQASNDWDEGPKVVNGASDLFVNVLGDKGLHSRSLCGVQRLPKNFSVGLTATFTIM